MSPSLVQNASAVATSTGPVTVTLGSPTAAGNCLVVVVGSYRTSANPTVSGITLGGVTDHFSQAFQKNTNADANCEVWTDQNCAGGQTSVVVSLNTGTGSSTGISVRVMEWSGVATAFAVDATSGNTASSSSYTSGSSGTLNQASEVVIGAVYSQALSSTPTTPGAPWTEFSLLSPATGQNLGVGYQVVSSTAAQTYSGFVSGAGPASAAVIVTLLAALPATSGLRVTAAGGGAASPGMLLRVRVLDNAILQAKPNIATNSAKDVTGSFGGITPLMTGSLIYSVATIINGLPPAGASGNTAIDSETDAHNTAHGTFVSTGTTTMGTPVFYGTSGVGGGAQSTVAAVEVQPYGGTIATDASSPAVLTRDNAIKLTTAAFQPPPGGKLILALVSMDTSSGTNTMAVSDSFGLTWTRAAEAPVTGNPYSAIWYAYTPAAPAVTGTPTAGVTGTPYSFAFAASGGYGGYSFTVASGSLPAGLSLSSSGVISGTPATAGLSTFTVKVTDQYGFTVTTPALSLIINAPITGAGSIRAGWTAAAPAYFYGTLQVPVSTTDHDWMFVSVSWQDSGDQGIAYCTDSARNLYQPVAFASGVVNTQVFAVPNAAAASTVYVSTSAFARYLTVCVLDVQGLQPGLVVDASQVYAGGPGTVLAESLSTAHPDFVLAVGAFSGTPQTITQSGAGVTWTSLNAGINGTASAGITQAAAWALPGGAASPARTFTAANSGNFSGAMVAVYSQGGLPANANPAWPVISCQAAFGYTPQEPTVPPAWTDITSRFLGLNGQRGRSFELDELAAADLTVHLDNFDGGLNPGGALGADLITPIRVIATWQGRVYPVASGVITAIPQAYDFQRGMVRVAVTDDFSKLAQTLLPTCMIQEMLYDKPVSLWPLNEQQQNGAASSAVPPPAITGTANNWSSRSVAILTPVAASQGGGLVPVTVPTVMIFGQAWAIYPHAPGTMTQQPQPPDMPTTGFGNPNSGSFPLALMGTTDSVWGNTSTQTILNTSSSYQGTVLVDANDSALPLTSTGATYSVWAQMFNVAANTVTGANIMTLTDANGPAGGKNYLTLYYDGTHAVVSQTAGSHSFTPSVPLFDGHWHMWTVTITAGGTVTLKLDGANLGSSFSGTFPSGTPSMLQWGGDTTATTAAAAGIFTGCMSLAGAYDRVVDDERIQSWYQSGATGFLDELGGTRIQRVLGWARWNAPQAVDPGLSMQQQFDYITGGYASNGMAGAIGQLNTAGGSAAVAQGAQASVTVHDIGNSENGFLLMRADGTLAFIERDRIANFPVGLALGDMDYALNGQQVFESGLGPWVNTVSCTVAQSAGWSYAGHHAALVTVTGTPVTAYAWGDSASVTPGQVVGFSCWVMSPQGCSVQAAIDFWGTPGGVDTYASLYTDPYGPSGTFGLLSTVTSGTVFCPPMTPVLLNLTGATVPAGSNTTAFPHPVIVSSPGAGTQLYFDRPRLSPPGFQVPYQDDVHITEDIQYLYNDIAVTRNVDQASYRARDAGSRAKYYPRIYTRTIFSSADDGSALQNCANFLVTNFAAPAPRVPHLVIDAARDPEAWQFVLSAEIGGSVSFTRNPVGGVPVTGTFTILSIEPDIAPDKAQFTYALAPGGVF